MVRQSTIRGTRSMTVRPDASREAAMSLSAEFFAPEIGTAPERRRPPSMRSRSAMRGSLPRKDSGQDKPGNEQSPGSSRVHERGRREPERPDRVVGVFGGRTVGLGFREDLPPADEP